MFRNRLLRLLPSKPTVAVVTQTGRVHRGRLVHRSVESQNGKLQGTETGWGNTSVCVWTGQLLTVRTVLSDVAQIRAPGRLVWSTCPFSFSVESGATTRSYSRWLATVCLSVYCRDLFLFWRKLTVRIVIICVRCYWKVCSEFGVKWNFRAWMISTS